jgi:hypothetical protein
MNTGHVFTSHNSRGAHGSQGLFARRGRALARARADADGERSPAPAADRDVGMPAQLPGRFRPGSAWRTWLLATRARARTSASGAPSSWFRMLRHWTPGLLPPLLSLLLLVLVVQLATHRAGNHAPLVSANALLPLGIIYLIVGTIFGALLYFAPSHTFWWLVLGAGLAAYLVVTLGIVTGPLGAAFALVVVGGAAFFYIRSHLLSVPANTVMLTRFAGAYHRTLPPGNNVLVPGERAVATVDLAVHEYTCPTQWVEVGDGGGARYVARAAATVSYRIVPAEAYRTIDAPEQWERELHELIANRLHDALTQWAGRMMAGDEIVHDRYLATTLLQLLRPETQARGVRIASVKVRDMWLLPESETIPVDDWKQGDAARTLPAASLPAATAPSQLSPPATTVQARSPVASAPPVAHDAPTEAGLAPSAASASVGEDLPPEVLVAAYEAILEGQIRDPSTIRDIARAFARIAADAHLSAAFPYDAEAASHNLFERAKYFDAETQASSGTSN